ncbi:hypothetical protein BDU57DRAFT_1476 [Ampelomyces quisqualis]|uniref:Uncharacterized protein n=1 Tax=Ampelomyces quisqualis TaxID=50730 RepID=A0A6A5QYX5_AMPQU|nr:hypothetical protein BDU57DRAFT_1476 [Ampelomyces quisqualis]
MTWPCHTKASNVTFGSRQWCLRLPCACDVVILAWMSNSNSALYHGSSWAEKCLYQTAPCLVTRLLLSHSTFHVVKTWSGGADIITWATTALLPYIYIYVLIIVRY